jgi:hypothetical protein
VNSPSRSQSIWIRLSKALGRGALIAAFLAVPALIASAALVWNLDATLADCVPVENDEVHYWNEIACFARAGFAGGYCVDDELPARASWTRFGPHGPGFPVIYGLLARIFDWHLVSGPFFNVGIVAIAAGLWIWLARPSTGTLVVGLLLLGTYWPLVIYLPSTYQESLHFAIGLVLAGLARRALGGSAGAHIAFVATVAAASVIKFSWILVLIPWAIATLPGTRWRTKLLILLTTACGVVAAVWVFTQICSPYPERLTPELGRASGNPMLYFWTLELRWERAWKSFFVLSLAVAPIGLVQRYQIMAVMLLGVGLLIARKYRRSAAFAAVNLFAILIPNMLFFDMYGMRDYRLIAPHMLLSLLLLLSADWRLVLPFVAANAAFVGVFLGHFTAFHRERVTADRQAIARVRAELAPLVPYRPGVDGWSNTLLFQIEWTPYRLLGLPPGIGVTFSLEDMRALLPKMRSKYVILSPGVAPPAGARLQLLANTSIGPLYENLECPD